MTFAATTVGFATVFRTIGLIVFGLVVVGYVVYLVVNSLQSRAEVGSEIEVAPNRKPYLNDEQLEGPRLEKVQMWALLSLVVIALGLPIYWVTEPGRQAGAREDFNNKFVERGASLFAPVGETDDALGCAGCHGVDGGGGSATYTLTNPDGTFDRQVTWKAPALNTVLLRYSRDEVTYILNYGRPFSPMPAWGVVGGGPLNDQQIQNLVDFLETIQITPDEAQKQATEELAAAMELKDENGDPLYKSEGEALFNLGLTDGFAGGAYACGRCHTQGWSYATKPSDLEDPGGGALGPSLQGESPQLQFPTNHLPPEGESPYQEMIDFVTEGSMNGIRYGVHGQGSGKMPGFGQRPDEPGLSWIDDGAERPAGPGMLTPEQIEAIVEYERNL